MNIILLVLGVAAAVHLICTATALSPRAPISMRVEVVLGFGAAVGMIVSALHQDHRSAMFTFILGLCLFMFYSELKVRLSRRPSNIYSVYGRRSTDTIISRNK